jgi:hypothetical protein
VARSVATTASKQVRSRAPAPVSSYPGAEATGFTVDSHLASCRRQDQINKSFLVLFFKKEQEKELLFEKRSKNFC